MYIDYSRHISLRYGTFDAHYKHISPLYLLFMADMYHDHKFLRLHYNDLPIQSFTRASVVHVHVQILVITNHMEQNTD